MNPDKNKDIDINLHNDLNNKKEGPHLDITTRLPKIDGSDKLRVDKDGLPVSGQTNIGTQKIKW